MASTVSGLVAVAFAAAVPSHAVGSDLPVAVPEVEVPDVPLPAPVPRVPLPQVPAPQLPAPQPPAPSVPDLPPIETGGLPSLSGGAPQIPKPLAPNRPGTWSPTLSGTGAAATGGPGTARSDGGSPAADRRARGASEGDRRRKQGIAGTRFKTPEKLVRGLRGCIDEIPRLQRAVLVLRYGVGSIDSRSRRATAHTLGTSARRVARIERRGLRSLARRSRSSGCEGTGVERWTFTDVVELLAARFVSDAFGTTTGLIAPGVLASDGEGGAAMETSGTEDGVAKVRGVRESGPADEDPGDDAPKRAQVTPFGDAESSSESLPSLLLLAAVVFGAVFLMRRVERAVR